MPTQSFNPSPTVAPRLRGHAEPSADRIDELSPHQLDAGHDQQRAAAVPGLRCTTGSQQSTRWTTSESLRSTFGDNLVNEFRVGGSGGATLFSPELEADMWSRTPATATV